MRNKNISIFLLILTIVSLSTTACNNAGNSEELDDLFFGLYFGMDKDAFFKACWDLNQEGKTHHGTIDNNVMYEDSINFDPKVVVNFYPKFVDDKIAVLPMSFYFKGWAPWNKNELKQDLLQEQVVRFFEQKYGGPLKEKKVANGKAYYKVIGPITIRIYNDKDEMIVKADIKHSKFQKTI